MILHYNIKKKFWKIIFSKKKALCTTIPNTLKFPVSKKKSPITTETNPTTYTENNNNFELGDLD